MIHIYFHLTTFPYIRCWLAAYNGTSHWDVGVCNIWLTHSHVFFRSHIMDTWNEHWGYLVILNIIIKVKSNLITNLFPTMKLNSEMKNGPNVTLMPKSIFLQSVLQSQKWNHCQLRYLIIEVTQISLIQVKLSQEFWLFWDQLQYLLQ